MPRPGTSDLEKELERQLFGASSSVFEAQAKKRKTKEKSLSKKKESRVAAAPAATPAVVVEQEKSDDGDVKSKKKKKSRKNGVSFADSDTHGIAPSDAAGRRQGPAWEDPDDARVSVRIAPSNEEKGKTKSKKKELGRSTIISGVEYEKRMREQFGSVHGSASWADVQEADEDVDAEFLHHAGRIQVSSSSRLPAGVIKCSRLVDVNRQDRCRSIVTTVQFHPRAANIVITGGLDKGLRLFQVDGKKNVKVQGVHFEDLPITNAVFSMDGSEITVSGNRPYMYVYNVEHGSIAKISQVVGRSDSNFKSILVSPDDKTLAAPGLNGSVTLLSRATRQRIGELRTGDDAVVGATYNSDGRILFVVSRSGHISEWDVATRRCIRRFHDISNFHPACLALSPNDQWLTCGSDSGIVSCYDLHAASSELPNNRPGASIPISAAKTLGQLVTSITDISFNGNDGQIMAMASSIKPNAMRLVHIPSFTVFSNWPREKAPLQHVTSMAFSPNGGMMTVGNAEGRALLFRLKHYGDL